MSTLDDLADLMEREPLPDVTAGGGPPAEGTANSPDEAVEEQHQEVATEHTREDPMPRHNQLPSQDHLRQLAKSGAQQFGPKSTAYDYDRLFVEYKQYAEGIHGSPTVTVARVFEFLTFQAHRPLRNEPLNLPLNVEGEQFQPQPKRRRTKYVFSTVDFHAVMEPLKSRSPSDTELPTANRLNTLDKHWAAILANAPDNLKAKLRDHQGIRDLRKYVVARKKTADSLSFKEKTNPQIEKFEYYEMAKKAERYFWDKRTGTTIAWFCASLRNRYHLLTTIQTLVRHESVLKCKLSDFQFVRYKARDEIDDYCLLFRNINVAKNLKSDADSGQRDVIQAKSLRHKDPEMCEQGALALYLYARSLTFDEDFDLLCNDNWFLIHTSVAMSRLHASQKDPRMTPMSSKPYYDSLNAAFLHHLYKPSHICHFGRAVGPVLLEFEEVLPQYIKELGNWELGVFERHYSSKMAWEAMRVAAGFRKEKGHYYVPRAHVKPSAALKQKVFPNVGRARLFFELQPTEKQVEMKTAKQFLSCMDYLAEVLLQDACCFLTTDRCAHPIYATDLFHCEEFRAFFVQFQQEYAALTLPESDPTFDRLKQCAPDIGLHLHAVHSHCVNQSTTTNELRTMTTELRHEMRQGFRDVSSQLRGYHSQWQAALEAAYVSLRTNDQLVPQQMEQTTQDTSPPRSPTPTRAGNYTHPPPPTMQQQNNANERATEGASARYPPIPERYISLQTMYDDWHGLPPSAFVPCGGIKQIDADKTFRKSLSQSSKKVLQRLSYINRFISYVMTEQQRSLAAVFEEIRVAFTNTKKQDTTLSGTADVLRKQLQWTGSKRNTQGTTRLSV